MSTDTRAGIGQEALAKLQQVLAKEPGWVIAFSGGVDSSVLLAAALEAVGTERVLAVLADSPSLARREKAIALATAQELGAPLRLLSTTELEDPRYRANTGDRCFWCKEALFAAAGVLAEERAWPLAYGEQADDHDDHRPGARSAAARQVRAPLVEAGWGKEDIRAYAQAHGLTVAAKVSAPCLASRIAVGQEVSRSILARIEAVEAALQDQGFRVLRARHLGSNSLRLEFAQDELPRARTAQASLQALAASHGYLEVEIAAYRRGSVALLSHGSGAGGLEV